MDNPLANLTDNETELLSTAIGSWDAWLSDPAFIAQLEDNRFDVLGDFDLFDITCADWRGASISWCEEIAAALLLLQVKRSEGRKVALLADTASELHRNGKWAVVAQAKEDD